MTWKVGLHGGLIGFGFSRKNTGPHSKDYGMWGSMLGIMTQGCLHQRACSTGDTSLK